MIQWVWIRCKLGTDINQAMYLACTGHLERSQLRCRPSPLDSSTTIDVEFLHFDETTIDHLKSLGWVDAAGPFPPNAEAPQDVPDPESIRAQLGIRRTVAA